MLLREREKEKNRKEEETIDHFASVHWLTVVEVVSLSCFCFLVDTRLFFFLSIAYVAAAKHLFGIMFRKVAQFHRHESDGNACRWIFFCFRVRRSSSSVWVISDLQFHKKWTNVQHLGRSETLKIPNQIE